MKLPLLLLLVNVLLLVNGQDDDYEGYEDEDYEVVVYEDNNYSDMTPQADDYEENDYSDVTTQADDYEDNDYSDIDCQIFNEVVQLHRGTQETCQICGVQCALEEKGMLEEDGYPNVDKILDWLYPREEFPQSRPLISHVLHTCISRTKNSVTSDDMCNGYAILAKCVDLSRPKICPGNEPCRNPQISAESSDQMNRMMKCFQCTNYCVMEYFHMVEENGHFTPDSMQEPYAMMDRRIVNSCMVSAQEASDSCAAGESFATCMFGKYQTYCL